MRFRNTTDRALSFAFDSRHAFECEPGGTVEIPDRLAYVVGHSGLPLVPVAQSDAPMVDAAPTRPVDASPVVAGADVADDGDDASARSVRPPPPMPKRRG